MISSKVRVPGQSLFSPHRGQDQDPAKAREKTGAQGHGLSLEPPVAWSPQTISQGWSVMPLDSDTLDRVKQLFVVTMPQELGKGRDAQKYGRSYQNLEVTCAWRLEYPSQWLKYAAERNSVNMNMQQLRRQEASKNMPGTLHAEVGERFLLHGTNPARILDILHQSFSDKLASLNGMFGAGSYVAEDPEKIDQYTTPNPGFEVPGLEELHSRLYRAGGNAHPGEDTFYCFLVRAVCGACQVVEGLDKDRLRDADSGTEVFLTPDRRVLSHIPHASPSLSYHTLVVNVAKHKVPAGVYRFREVVLFDGNRIYPEYLLAYRRI